MISTEECRKIICEAARPLEAVEMPLADARGHFLAGDLEAPIDLPAFDESAMDGYAVRVSDLSGNAVLPVSFEVRAGESELRYLPPGSCARIFTGAPVPPGADAVVKQEDVHPEEAGIRFPAGNSKGQGENIRPRGGQCLKGDVVLRAGQELNPAAIGLLAGLGLTGVAVRRAPFVSVLSTGPELAGPGKPLKPGQKYNSNNPMLEAAFAAMGIRAGTSHCADNLQLITRWIEKKSRETDILIICGGVSVGDYDFTPQAARAAGFDILLHGVKQKPGKPMLFARRGNRYLFGLPGNPRAVITAFYLYVKPFVRACMGATRPFPVAGRALLQEDVTLHQPRTHYITGILAGEYVKPLWGQASHMLKSFAEAGVIMELSAEKHTFKAGETVTVYRIN